MGGIGGKDANAAEMEGGNEIEIGASGLQREQSERKI